MPKGKKGPSDEDIQSAIDRLLPQVNLEKTGVKAFIEHLQKEAFNGSLPKNRMAFVKSKLVEAVNLLPSDDNKDAGEEDDDDSDADASDASASAEDDDDEEEDDDDSDSSDADDEDDDDEAPRKRRGAGRGLSVKKELSPELAAFLGQDTASRTEVVKQLWDYIKEHGLQNPDNKREILLDAKMKDVFGVDTFTMFTMNKYVAAHIHPFKEVDLTSSSSSTPRKKSAAAAARRAAGSSLSSRKKRKVDVSDKLAGKKKRKPKKPGLQPPYQLSSDLAAVVGKDILPRPQVVAAIWDYIKYHGLQNPNDKREILCDEKLQKIMGGNQRVTMFNMNRFITQHLLEKLDRSAYNHEEAVAEAEEEEEEDDEEEEEDEDEEESD
jgi:upstream activation factor subunit UAF30